MSWELGLGVLGAASKRALEAFTVLTALRQWQCKTSSAVSQIDTQKKFCSVMHSNYFLAASQSLLFRKPPP